MMPIPHLNRQLAGWEACLASLAACPSAHLVLSVTLGVRGPASFIQRGRAGRGRALRRRRHSRFSSAGPPSIDALRYRSDSRPALPMPTVDATFEGHRRLQAPAAIRRPGQRPGDHLASLSRYAGRLSMAPSVTALVPTPVQLHCVVGMVSSFARHHARSTDRSSVALSAPNAANAARS